MSTRRQETGRREAVRSHRIAALKTWILPAGAGLLLVGLRSAPAEPHFSRRTVEAVAPPISLAPHDVHALMNGGERPRLVFVGPEGAFRAGRIPGAERIDPDAARGILEPDPERLVIFYSGCCPGGQDVAAAHVLAERGHRRVACLEGHLDGWIGEGFPVEHDVGVERSPERAYETPEQYRSLKAFVEGVREEAQSVPEDQRDGWFGRMEIEGLLLKRRIAEENRDMERVRQIDELLRQNQEALK